MYDTNFEIIYNFLTGLKNLDFNEAFSTSDLCFMNRLFSMVVCSVSRLDVIFNMTGANMTLILSIICYCSYELIICFSPLLKASLKLN